jgi:hypothetical protein
LTDGTRTVERELGHVYAFDVQTQDPSGRRLAAHVDVDGGPLNALVIVLEHPGMGGVGQYTFPVQFDGWRSWLSESVAGRRQVEVTLDLPGWTEPGTYAVRLASGQWWSDPVATVNVAPVTTAGRDLLPAAHYLTVPPANVEGHGPEHLPDLFVSTAPAGQLGAFATATGWNGFDEMLAYVDLGQVSHVEQIVAHGVYGKDITTPPPVHIDLAVSEDGLKWRSTPLPLMPDRTAVMGLMAFHAGVEGLGAQARYVRVRLNAPDDGYVFRAGVLRTAPGRLYLSRVQVFGTP